MKKNKGEVIESDSGSGDLRVGSGGFFSRRWWPKTWNKSSQCFYSAYSDLGTV